MTEELGNKLSIACLQDKTWQPKIFMPMDRRDNLVDLVPMLNPSSTDMTLFIPKSYPNGASSGSSHLLDMFHIFVKEWKNEVSGIIYSSWFG